MEYMILDFESHSNSPLISQNGLTYEETLLLFFILATVLHDLSEAAQRWHDEL